MRGGSRALISSENKLVALATRQNFINQPLKENIKLICMEPVLEESQTINTQLRQLPAYQALLAPKPEATPVPLTASRVVAALMQVKDTAAILLLLSNGALIVGVFCGFGVPGLVLYGLRWRQVRGRAARNSTVVQAVLSLLHELFCTCLFYSQSPTEELFEHSEALTILYGLGTLLSMLQLLAAMSDPADEDYYASLPDEQLAD
jgi:hypothetical protein